MDYLITPITEQHIPNFRDAVDYVARELKYLAFLEAPPLEQSRSYVMENIKQGYPHLVVLAEGKVVGWCDIIPNISRPLYRHTGILGIGLLPDFRGRGIGGELMKEAISKAAVYGLTRVELTVRAGNRNAVSLYQKLGFRMEGTKKNAIRLNGAYEDLHLMGLLLEEK